MAKWLFLLRAFFPSWRFFDVVGSEFVLEARVVGPDEETGGDSDWQRCLPPIPRSLSRLVLNAEGNFLHACHNLISHLVADSVLGDDIVRSPNYRLTANLVRYQLSKNVAAPFDFQFRVRSVNESSDDLVLLSEKVESP